MLNHDTTFFTFFRQKATNGQRWVFAKRRLASHGIAVFLLSGCAAEMAYRDGKNLVQQGKFEEGITKLQEAHLKEPRDGQYRAAYLQSRDRALATYLSQADQLVENDRHEEAASLFGKVLSIDARNERARAGLFELELKARHQKAVNDAGEAIARGDMDAARQKLNMVLTENPKNNKAKNLLDSISERVVSPSNEVMLAAKYKKPITIEFRDATLKQIFELLSRTSGLNFVFDKDVKTDQRTSIFLKESTIESALHFTLLTNQLDQQVLDKNTVLIYPNTAAKQKDYQEMIVRSFFLTNAEAKTVATTLKTIIKSRDIVVDEKLNMLIVRDSAEAIKLAEKLIALQDVAEPEVMLEVEIIEVARTRLEDLGIQWPASVGLTPLPLGSTFGNSVSTATGIAGTTVTGTTSSNTGSLSLNDLLRQNKRSIGASIGTTTIKANVQDSDTNLLANPRIRARNHEKAKILIGERVPNITSTATSTGFVSQSINYVDIGLTLNVEPTVYLDNDVGIKVSMEVSNIINQVTTQSGTTAYEIGTRTASTTLRLKDGETQVLAGLINDEDRRSGNKLPGVGELPVLDRLFGAANSNKKKTEIVLSITPHLIRNIQRPNSLQAEFRAGTDSNLRSRPEGGAVMPSLNQQNIETVRSQDATTQNQQNNDGNANNINNTGAGSNSNLTNIGSGTINTVADNGLVNAGGVSNVMQLTWLGPTTSKIGESFTIQLSAQSDLPVSNLPVTLQFDNKVLQLTSITEGNFLKQGGAQSSFTSRVDPNGQIIITNTRLSDGGGTTPGTIASINFMAIAPANNALIQVVSAVATGANKQSIAPRLPAAFSLQINSQ